MGFWNKLGKIALQAAPYVAAPFTGGASLMATGATQKLGQKWAEHDAKKAIAKGLAPSKFDTILGKVSAGAGLGSMAFGGALGNLGKAGSVGAGLGKGAQLGSIASKAGTGASTASKLGNLGKIATAAAGKGGSGWTGALGKAAGTTLASKGIPVSATGEDAARSGDWGGALAAIMNRQPDNSAPMPDAARYLPPDNSVRMPQPNIGVPRASTGMAAALNRGTNQALYNQPFRGGYQTHIQGPEEGQVITTDMPRIYPNYGPPAPAPESNSIFNQAPPQSNTPIQNAFADELTPRRTPRRRAPVEEEY